MILAVLNMEVSNAQQYHLNNTWNFKRTLKHSTTRTDDVRLCFSVQTSLRWVLKENPNCCRLRLDPSLPHLASLTTDIHVFAADRMSPSLSLWQEAVRQRSKKQQFAQSDPKHERNWSIKALQWWPAQSAFLRHISQRLACIPPQCPSQHLRNINQPQGLSDMAVKEWKAFK